MTSYTLLVVCLASVTASVVADCTMSGCPDKLQEYLTMFGYLDPDKPCTSEDLKAGLTKFQEMNINFHGLQVSGECDNITRSVMDMPRCGCEDIVKGEKKMMPPQNLMEGPQAFRTFPTKWSKRDLTWKVLEYPRINRHLTNGQVDDAMQRALNIWAVKTSMTFSKETGRSEADINIKFVTRRHTVQPPFYDFDGRGNVLAHAFSPESGVVHFDDDENFVLGTNQGTELFIVAAHEFGHTLGISHSNQQEALMAPYYRYSENLQLHSDDIQAIQSLYGRPTNNPTSRPQPTPAPTRPPRPTNPPEVPDYCNMDIAASFKIDSTTYIFTRERLSNMRSKTFVYQVTDNGINVGSRTPIEDMFKKRSRTRYPLAYPYRVDAAAYIPHKEYVFLFSGTRAYRYRLRRNVFYLEETEGFPKWMDVSEFPERPRAAVAMPYASTNPTAYYMLIFGTTMVWDWNFFSERVGAWAYPIDVFGRSMPLRVDSAYLQGREYVVFFKGDKFYKFSLYYRRVLDNGDSVKDVKKDFLKGDCM